MYPNPLDVEGVLLDGIVIVIGLPSVDGCFIVVGEFGLVDSVYVSPSIVIFNEVGIVCAVLVSINHIVFVLVHVPPHPLLAIHVPVVVILHPLLVNVYPDGTVGLQSWHAGVQQLQGVEVS